MDKFQGRFRISSTRLKDWDYASKGMYYVTLCTKNREHYFGEIINTKSNPEHFEMQYSSIGMMVESEWLKTPEVRPDMNLSFGEFQIMPNHFHAILIIGENQFNTIEGHIDRNAGISGKDLKNECENDSEIELDSNSEDPNDYVNICRDAMPRVSFKSELQAQSDYAKYSELEIQMINKNKFAPQSKNLASILRGFKSSVTMFALDNKIDFGWQPRFYDHVIRDFEDYERISKYIKNNPAKWNEDHLR